MSKDAYYFSHDSNARQDPKILEMVSVYGMEGYGRYWVLIELLREQSDHTLKLSGKYAFNALAMQMHCKADALEQFVHDCINEFELFESDGNLFWSNSLIRRMALKEDISQKRKKAAEARWSKKPDKTALPEDSDANGMQMHSTSNANGMQGKESKRKESKGNESKLKLKPEADAFNAVEELISNNIITGSGITKTLTDDLNDIYESFGFAETDGIINEAIKVAVRGNGKTWRFIFNKLDYWRKSGVKTLFDAKSLESKGNNYGKEVVNGGKDQSDDDAEDWVRILKERAAEHERNGTLPF